MRAAPGAQTLERALAKVSLFKGKGRGRRKPQPLASLPSPTPALTAEKSRAQDPLPDPRADGQGRIGGSTRCPAPPTCRKAAWTPRSPRPRVTPRPAPPALTGRAADTSCPSRASQDSVPPGSQRRPLNSVSLAELRALRARNRRPGAGARAAGRLLGLVGQRWRGA